MAAVADPAPHAPTPDEAAVRAANAAFYEAFESRDLDAMSEVWEHSDRVSVTHPGWPMLRGWARVAGSWDAIFANTAFFQFLLSDEQVVVEGDLAWVTLDENILQAGGSREGGEDLAELQGSRVAAVNVYARAGGRWRLVLHHGSPVVGETDPGLDPGLRG
jgi:ketosteroid isomerase-like protein